MNAKLSCLGKNAKIALNESLIELFCHLFFAYGTSRIILIYSLQTVTTSSFFTPAIKV